MKIKYLNKLATLAGAILVAASVVSSARADYISTLSGLGPVGWWRLNDSTATNALFTVTNAGFLGNAANGVVVQAASGDTPLLGQPGLIGNCVQFQNPGNTVGLCDSKIDVPWRSELSTNPPFTIEFWTEPNTLGSDSTGFSPLENFNPSGDNGSSRRGWLFYVNNAGLWNFRLGAYSGYTVNLTTTNGNAAPGSWQHIVATWDGSNVLLYANGVVIGKATNAAAKFPSDGWTPNAVSFLRMGGSPLTGNNAVANANASTSTIGNRGYDGYLQHVAIYTNVLSPATIASHYSAGLTGNLTNYESTVLAASPVGYWPLQDTAVTAPSPTTIADSGIDGTATGTVYPGVKVRSGPGYGGFGADTNGLYVDGDNGYVQINDTPNLNGTNGSGIASAITLTAWVKPQAQDYFRDIIARGFDENDNETYLRISHGPFYSGPLDVANTGDTSGDDQQYYEVGTTDGINFIDQAQFPIPPGDIGHWVFLAGVYDPYYGAWEIYRNGQFVAYVYADYNDGDTGPVLPAQDWTIGSRAPDIFTPGTVDDATFDGQGENFEGTIFEPAIFNTALSPSQILSLYNAAQVPPILTQAPTPENLYEGQTISLSVVADGNATLAYQWYKNAGLLAGQTASTYTKTNVAVADSGTYSVVVTNSYGSFTSSVAVVVSASKPIITVQPTPVTRFVGLPYAFSVTAVGSPTINYQWLTNGVAITGATNSVYTNTVQLSLAGNYSVVLSNYLGSATSSVVALTAVAVPSGYPTAVYNSGPLSYWRLDETNGSTTAHDLISGNDGVYNSVTLGLPGYSVLDPDTAAGFTAADTYVGSISGTAINFATISNAFTLEAWVNAPAGQKDQATIIAKGIGNNGTTETEQFALDVSGGNYRVFTTAYGQQYQAVAFGGGVGVGPNGTWQHVVGVFDPSTIASQSYPTLRLYVNGVQVASILVQQAPNLTTSPVSIGSKRTGNSPSYDGTFIGTIDEVAVYNKALDPATIVAHYNAAYGSTLIPTITSQPQSTTNYVGLPITLSVSEYGSAPITNQWYKGTPPGGTPVGGNSTTFTISSPASTDAGSYYLHISNPVLPGGTNTTVVNVSVLPAPTSPPNIPGLVAHLTLNGTLTDSTGRSNNGTGYNALNPWGYPANPDTNGLNAITNVVVTPSGTTYPYFYYNSGPFTGSQGLHYYTIATNSGGLQYSGTSAGTNDFYVSLGSRPDFNFGTNSFSISFWIREEVGFGETAPYGGDLPFFGDVTNSTGGWGFVSTISYGYGTEAPNPNPAPLYYEVGAFGASVYDGAGNGVRYVGNNGVNPINDGYYHNIVQVINRSSGSFITYIDGVPAEQYLQSGTSFNQIGSIDNGAPWVIGQDPTGLYGEDGDADIADLGVWRKALSPLEVGAIYTAGTNNLSYTGTGYATSIKLTSAVKTGSSATIQWIPTPLVDNTFSVLSSTNVARGWITNATGITATNYTDLTATNLTKFYRVTSP
jgi:hypothetical protein